MPDTPSWYERGLPLKRKGCKGIWYFVGCTDWAELSMWMPLPDGGHCLTDVSIKELVQEFVLARGEEWKFTEIPDDNEPFTFEVDLNAVLQHALQGGPGR